MSPSLAGRLGPLAYSATYIIAAVLCSVWLAGNGGQLTPLLASGNLLILLPLFSPVLLGALLQLLGRRLWIWPWLYLAAALLVHTAGDIDVADQLYLYSSQLAAVLVIALAEVIGLSLGRWINRPSAIGYFCIAGVIQIVYAFGADDGQLPNWIRQVTFSLAGGLFLLQALIQLFRYARHENRRNGRDGSELADESAPDDD